MIINALTVIFNLLLNLFKKYFFFLVLFFIFFLNKIKEYIPINYKQNTTLVVFLDNEYLYQSKSFIQLITALEKASTDPYISEIFLDLNGMVTLENNYTASVAVLQELRESLDNCKKQGKKISIYSENFDLLSYYIALSSDNIMSTRYGRMMLGGFSQRTKFYKRLFDNLSINYTLSRPNDNVYKSAGEVYTKDKFSEISKQPILDYAKDIDEIIFERINKDILQRNDTFDIKKEVMISNLKGAKEGLIDKFKYKDQLYDLRKRRNFLYLPSFQREENPPLLLGNTISLNNYYKSIKSSKECGMIFINGQLGGLNLFQNENQVTKLNNEVDYIIKSKKIKKVAICIDCPGGAVQIGDEMFRALKRLKKAKKEIIVIQGTVAASGGYWLSVIGDRIIARPLTVTGSIGVFSVIPNFLNLFKKIGIDHDYINPSNNFYKMLQEKDEKLKKNLEDNVEEIYKVFKEHINFNRKKEYNYKIVGQGRFYSGKKALDYEIVDSTEGFRGFLNSQAKINKLGQISISKVQLIDISVNNSSLISFIKSIIFSIKYFNKIKNNIEKELNYDVTLNNIGPKNLP